MVSADFLASDYIAKKELPPFLKAEAEGSTLIYCVSTSCLRKNSIGNLLYLHLTVDLFKSALLLSNPGILSLTNRSPCLSPLSLLMDTRFMIS
jgi:hypothetical protein